MTTSPSEMLAIKDGHRWIGLASFGDNYWTCRCGSVCDHNEPCSHHRPCPLTWGFDAANHCDSCTCQVEQPIINAPTEQRGETS